MGAPFAALTTQWFAGPVHAFEAEQMGAVDNMQGGETVFEEAENGVTRVYNTMDLFIFQTFFDKLSSEFVPGLLAGFEKVKLPNVNGTIPLFDEDLVFNYELNETHISSAAIDQTPPLV